MENKQPISRKYKITWGILGLATLGFLATGFLPALQACYSTFIGGLALGAGLYHGGNVADSFMQSKTKKDSDPGAP